MSERPPRPGASPELRSLLRAPKVAAPTILLLMIALSLWSGSIVSASMGLTSWPLSFLINVLLAYIAFTPMHDAAHRSIVAHKGLAGVLGRLAAIPLTAPFAAFRYVHLQHHRYTNEVGRDPDLWSGQGPSWLLPLRWLSQDGHYYICWLRAWRRHNRQDRLELGFDVLFLLSLIVLGSLSIGFEAVLVLWLLPARLAIAALAWSFDYLPHRPHQIEGRRDRYRATHALRGDWLSLPLLCQNLHIIHHLYPGVPFYRYPAIWNLEREPLMNAGVRVLGVFERAPGDQKSEAGDGAGSQ